MNIKIHKLITTGLPLAGSKILMEIEGLLNCASGNACGWLASCSLAHFSCNDWRTWSFAFVNCPWILFNTTNLFQDLPAPRCHDMVTICYLNAPLSWRESVFWRQWCSAAFRLSSARSGGCCRGLFNWGAWRTGRWWWYGRWAWDMFSITSSHINITGDSMKDSPMI